MFLKVQHLNPVFKVECWVGLLCFFIFLYIQAEKQLFNSFKVLVEVSLVFIMTNKPNTDQALIQKKRLEKVRHIDSTQW